MRIQAEMRAQKEAERDAYRKKMEELAQRRKWEQIHRKKLEDERLASIQVAKVPTPPKEKKKRGGQKQSLFRETKPLSASELSVYLESAACSVFDSDDSSNFPESISVSGHPNTTRVQQYATRPKYVRRQRYEYNQ